MLDEGQARALRPLLWIALTSIVIGGSVDLLLDRPQEWLSFHVVFEAMMIAGALLMAVTLWLGWYRAERAVGEVKETLARRLNERDAWRRSAQRALEGLAAAMDRQFRAWGLTAAEREVALLLLKGYSHKHVATATGRSERTARQHAVSIYQKAGLQSRAELAAFFLEDLLLPDASASSDAPAVGPSSSAEPADLEIGAAAP